MKQTAKQAHRRLAVFLGLFLVVHFSTHLSAIGGIAMQDTILQWGRSAYRIPIVEIALVLALMAQVAIGIGLLRRIAKRTRKGFWHWVQFISACYLAYFVTMHTSAALISRLALGLDTNFYWAAGTLVLEPLKYGFAPYYFFAVSALVGHLLAALHFNSPARWHAPALMLGPIAGLAIVLAYGGAFFAVELPQEHLDYFNLYPGVGK